MDEKLLREIDSIIIKIFISQKDEMIKRIDHKIDEI